MSENTGEIKVTEEGVPIIPSDTVFREAILDGKTIEEAEYLAEKVGEARAESVEGFLRWQVTLVWKRVMQWAGGISLALTAGLLAYSTQKINMLIEFFNK